MTQPRPVLLYVDDRPSTLTERLLERDDLTPILLRFSEAFADLPEAHLESTREIASFVVDSARPPHAEATRFREWADGRRLSPTAFLNPSEPRQHVSQRFARLLRLPCLTAQQVDRLRNKVAMKARLNEMGIATTAFAPVEHRADILAFGERHGWPLVVKPQDGFACIDTYTLHSSQDVMNIDLSPGRDWMIERFVQYKEWEVCALVQGGKVLDAYLSYFPAPPLEAVDGAINANISVGPVKPDFGFDWRTMVADVVHAFDINHGYLHAEFFADGGGCWLMSEAGLRLAGCEIPNNHALAHGFDIFGNLIDIHLGWEVEFRYTQARSVGDLLLPLRPGRVEAISSIEELSCLEGVIAGKIKVAAGDQVTRRRASHTSSGYVHVEGRDFGQVESRMRNILRKFNISTFDPITERGAVS